MQQFNFPIIRSRKMKPSHHFAVLILTMAMLALAITLPATRTAHASDPGEEPIRATLEDANESLGGGFVLDPENSVMTRTRQGAYANGEPVDITDYFSITSETPNTYCESYPGEFWHPSTFHGKDGCSLTYGDHPANMIWESQFGSQSRGDDIVLDVGSIVDECYCYVQHPDEGPRVSYDSINVLPMAEALNQAAIKNELYAPMPGEVVPPVAPTDPTVPTDSGGVFGIPPIVILGSLGIPVLGALAGAAVASLGALLGERPVIDPSVDEAADQAHKVIDEAAAQAAVIYQKGVFYGKFDQIIKQKLDEHYYIKNPAFATSPDWPEWFAPVKDIKDWAVSKATQQEDKGGRCGEAALWGAEWLGSAARDTFGPGTYDGEIGLTRPANPEDQIVNHISYKLILPNGERLVPEIHESLITGKAVLYTEKEWIEKYGHIVGGPPKVERFNAEDKLVALLGQHGPEEGVRQFKLEEAYQDEVQRPVLDAYIRSYLKHPPTDPIPGRPPVRPQGITSNWDR
jgi:hypothetical protein